MRIIKGLLFGFCALAFAGKALSQDIVIGQCVPLTGSLASTGKEMSTGARIAFEAANAAGGIGGRKIRHVVQDDAYQTEKTVACTQDLIKNQRAVALIGYAGTGNIAELLKRKILADADIALVAPYTGGTALREPFNPYIFHIRASYNDETAKMVEQFVRSGITRIGVFYQNDAFGQSGLEGVQQALAKRELKVHAAASYEKNSEDVSKAVSVLGAAAPQAIIMVAITRPAAVFARQIKRQLPGTQIFSISVVNGQELYTLAGDEGGRGVGITQVMPSPFAGTQRIVREYNEALSRFAPGVEASYASFEEYVGGRVLIEGLKRVRGAMTPSSVKAALETVSTDVGGYAVRFGPNLRAGSKFVEVTLLGAGGANLR